jgi:hypothetical protein
LYFNQYASDNVGIGNLAAYNLGYNNADTRNFAIGNYALYWAGSSGAATHDNIAIGAHALENQDYNGSGSIGNLAIGHYALAQSGFTSSGGTNNIAIGNNSGYAVDGGSNNVIIGSYSGSAAPISVSGSNYVVLSDGAGTVRQTINGSGALSFNAGTSYGTAGQLLQSNGSGAAPSWGRTITSGTAAPSGGSDGDIYLQYV